MLVKNGIISADELQAAIDAQERHRDRRIGELLMDMGFLSREALRQHIREQIEEAVYFLFTWNQGTFNFEADVQPEEQDFLVSINPESLLLEGARRVDEWTLVEKKIPTFDIVFEIDRPKLEKSDVELTAEQRALLELVDGQRDVQQIIDASGMGEFDVGKLLYGLATAGFLHRIGTSKAAGPQVVRRARGGALQPRRGVLQDRYVRRGGARVPPRARSAAAGPLGPVLPRPGGAAPGAVGRRPRRIRGGRRASGRRGRGVPQHGLRPGAAGPLRRRATRAARSGQAQRRHQSGHPGLDRHRRAARAATWRPPTRRSAPRAPSGRRRPPTAAWYHYSALTAALLGDLARAQSLLDEAVGAHPRSAMLHNNLAVVLERRNNPGGASAALDRALAEDPSVPQIHKNLGDVAYRAGRFDDALADYQRAIKADPELGDDVYLKLGNIRFRQQHRDEALALLGAGAGARSDQRHRAHQPRGGAPGARMTEADPPDDGFQALLDKISRDRGFRCASYKPTCLRRRVGVRMRARGVHRYADYAGLLDRDAAEYDLLLDALTINVTKLFRNPEVYHALAREVVPALWASSQRADPRVVRRVRVGGGAVLRGRAVPSARRGAPGPGRPGPRGRAGHRHRPAQPRGGRAGRVRGGRLQRDAARVADAVLFTRAAVRRAARNPPPRPVPASTTCCASRRRGRSTT